MDTGTVDSFTIHPIDRLEGRDVGGFRLFVPVLVPAERVGWRRFEINLSDGEGDFFPPVVCGIHSRGSRSVGPWIEITDYQPTVGRADRSVDAHRDGFEVPLFRALASVIPPGGHVLLRCEAEPHHATALGLERGVPPVLTPLGRALLEAGFPCLKHVEAPEGGRGGGRKLWAEKPLDEATADWWLRRTSEEVERFVLLASAAQAGQPDAERGEELLQSLKTSQPARAQAAW